MPGSPAAEARLEVCFDFVVRINDTAASADQVAFFQKVRELENNEVKLKLYNIRVDEIREVAVTPRRWDGEGLLGVQLRHEKLDNFLDAYAISVLSVATSSPAERAELVPMKDFLLGTMQVMFRNIDDVSNIISVCQWENRTVSVYNSDSKNIREVAIYEDCLGADLQPMALHKIPVPLGLVASAVGCRRRAWSHACISSFGRM